MGTGLLEFRQGIKGRVLVVVERGRRDRIEIGLLNVAAAPSVVVIVEEVQPLCNGKVIGALDREMKTIEVVVTLSFPPSHEACSAIRKFPFLVLCAPVHLCTCVLFVCVQPPR